MDLELGGKVALITGGSRGIGHAIARGFAAEGCRVGICARNADDLAAAAAGLEREGGEVTAVQADVTEAAQMERFITTAAHDLGGVDILVNNVGGSAGGGLEEASDEDWLTTFDLNVFHSVRATRAVVPHLRRRGGGVVLMISSISGTQPAPEAQYGTAKAAESFLARCLALELGGDGIRVNALAPGSTMFPGGGWDAVRSEEPGRFNTFVRRQLPAHRLACPEEIAHVAVFLASPRASWVNGAVIPVDGAQMQPKAFSLE